MKKSTSSNPRLAALSTLCHVLDRSRNLADADETGSLPDARDRALAMHLAYGVVRWLNSLQWLSGQLLGRPLKKKDRDINRLVLLGLYQLWQDRTAPHAVINETAECARLLGKPWAVGLVNAILRRFQREQQHWLDRLEEQPERFAHPQWILHKIQADWPDEWQGIIQANNRPAPLWLRINRSKPGQKEIAGRLEKSGFTTESHPAAPDAVRVMPAAVVGEIPGFQDGHFSVQDPAAQLAVDLLKLDAEHRVLDSCAAPGGKTCHILERFPSIEMTAIELSESRLGLIQENVDRLRFSGRDGLRLVAGDAAEPSDWWDGEPFDRILLDAPCTATGVIRRHPEIKWLRSTEQFEKVIQLQEKLLTRLWPLLKVDGILVYATCSVLVDENRSQISRFLADHNEAEAVFVEAAWGHDQNCGRQILPGEEEMDGFFYACMRKIA
jgi:16S rRNA (cytosine967-C5)-methyltransferase